MKTIENIASELRDDSTSVQLLYAFNSVGKTRLSVAYKNATKEEDGTHAGNYYNAYSEDLFVWNNDIENGEANIDSPSSRAVSAGFTPILTNSASTRS